MLRYRNTVSGLAILVVILLASPAPAQKTVDFNRDILPILSDTCFKCHGPDDSQRMADLKLHTREGLFRFEDDVHVVAPGDVEKSELVRRITSNDPDEKMPPTGSDRELKPEQIELLRRWVAEGAEWKQHWSFITPTRPDVPDVSERGWVANPIDAFVLARLDREKLKHGPPAEARTALRRLAFDLTGLPPSAELIRAFDKNRGDEAWEHAIDTLLASEAYAERMAIRWLDAARYADTSGYQSDGPRYMWRWRDWVIEAFHNNKPFDEFTVEQLAGDLLPNPTLDQQIATAFNRNHRGNAEGGIVPEEFQVEYVVDRVDTTATIWLGLTMGCARCHSHKYDPITQKEYYQVYAYFNNIPEYGRALKEGNSKPWIKAPTRAQQRQLKQLERKTDAAEALLATKQRELGAQLVAWEKSHREAKTVDPIQDWTVTESLVASVPPKTLSGFHRDAGEELPSLTVRKQGKVETVAGRVGLAVRLSGDGHLEAGNVGKFGYFDQFSFGAWVYQDEHRDGTIVSKMVLVNRGGGYNLHVTDRGTVQVNLVKRWLDDSLRVETLKSIPTGRWVHLFATYNGMRTSDAIRIFIDGRPVAHQANLDGINQSFVSDEPLRVGAGNSNFHGAVADARVYSRRLLPYEVRIIAEATPTSAIVSMPRGKRSPNQRFKLVQYFQHVAGPKDLRVAFASARDARRELRQFRRDIPSVMVMEESGIPRETHFLIRGQYDRPGERVSAGVPSWLPALPQGAAKNRLTLASWLVREDHPLTARVTVNRFWRDLFGTGLVKTTEDFGAQGERPSHPELLDWLAVDFVESGWDVKRLIKTIVMSNTYRQSSRVSPELLQRDPENRLLARGPRFRLPAEMIRDQALAISGLLTRKVGGPSVKPYQPEGLWSEIASDTEYALAKGDDLYRRSLYTYWKRTVAPPMMMTFDASGREMCEVRQTRTNTPLQALNLMNDVTFVEAARVLAQNVFHAAKSDDARFRWAFQKVTARGPSKQESEILLASLGHYQKLFAGSPESAKSLIAYGASPVDEKIPPAELAAWTTICSTLLNLDETVTKE